MLSLKIKIGKGVFLRRTQKGDEIRVKVVRKEGGAVYLGFQAPRHVDIKREELVDAETRRRFLPNEGPPEHRR